MPERRAGPNPRRPRELPELELECIKVLWAGGELSVRDVQQRLRPVRSLAYTTVLTVLDRLARKGVVERRRIARAHLYQAVLSREEARAIAVSRVVEHHFDGSREALAAYAGGDAAGQPARPRAVAAAAVSAAGGFRLPSPAPLQVPATVPVLAHHHPPGTTPPARPSEPAADSESDKPPALDTTLL